MLFDKNILICGKHGSYVKQLASKLDKDIPYGVFKRNLDVYLLSPIVGLVYNCKAQPEKSDDGDTSIHMEQMNSVRDQLEFNFRLVTLLIGQDKFSLEERIDRAFRYDRDDEKRKEADSIFIQYTLGGIEKLYEKVMDNGENTELEAVLKNLKNFIIEFELRYKDSISCEDIYEICKMTSK